MVVWYRVPPVIGVVPVACTAATIVWGVHLAVNTSTLSVGATLYHGYISTP